MRGKYFAVPWQAFTVDEDKKRLVLDVSKERLQTSPGFDKDRWPLSNDDTYYTSVDRFYSGATRGLLGTEKGAPFRMPPSLCRDAGRTAGQAGPS